MSALGDRALALAGTLQALKTAHYFAHKGILGSDRDTVADFQTAVGSLFQFRPASAEAVFGGVGNLRRGIEALERLQSGAMDDAQLHMTRDVEQVARHLLKRPNLLNALREELQTLRPETTTSDDGELYEGVDRLYRKTISTLSPRLRLRGEPAQLQQPAVVHRLRTLLMAAVRSAVLWRQRGGNALTLAFERQALYRAAERSLKRPPDASA